MKDQATIRHAGRRSRRLWARRGSVSVEFALVSVFFLFPLIAGGLDMVLVLPARAKLNSALHAIYMFAWSNPGSAGDVTQLQGVIQAINPALPASTITLAGTPAVTHACFNASGAIDPAAVFAAALPGVAGSVDRCLVNGAPDPTEVPSLLARYGLSSVIQLPVPVPFLANPVTLTASGTIDVE